MIVRPGRYQFILAACAIVLAGALARVAVAALKTDYHVDEGITLALTNGTWSPPVVAGLFERWVDKAELEEFVFNGKLRALGRVDFDGISRSTAWDVHPPLFYWLYAAARLAVGVDRHMAACLLVNLPCFAFAAVFLMLAMRRATGDRRLSLLALALFAFSPAGISVTSFIRMYELLSFACAGFFCCAAFAVIPGQDGRFGASRWVAVVALAAFSFIGALSHYYFLLFALPVCAACALILARRGDAHALLWGALAVLVGLYAAYRVFPAMETHLFHSYRAKEGVGALLRAGVDRRLASVWAFALIVVRYMPAIAAVFAVAGALAVPTLRTRLRAMGAKAGATMPSATFVALLGVVFAFTFLAVSLTAPYRSLRYLVAFGPVYAMFGACAVTRLLPRRRAHLALGAALALGVMPGLFPFNIAHFHEDYPVDRDPAYLSDGTPIIVVSNAQGFSWRNMLPYKRIPRGTRVYVTMRDSGQDLARSLAPAVSSSGSETVYAMVDALFSPPRDMERVGYYGFFGVYRVRAPSQ